MARTKHVVACSDAVAATSATSVVAFAVTKKRRRGHSSSERGRAFRKRQEEKANQLELYVNALRASVRNHEFLRSVWEAKYLRSRHSLHGSLVMTVREYHERFRFGLRPASPLGQEAFVQSVMDPYVDIGSASRGPQALLQQWRLHTSAFERYSGEMVSEPVVVGSDEFPLVQVQIAVRALIGDATLRGLFPQRARDAARHLLRPVMGSFVQFACRTSFQFTPDGRIRFLVVQMDYADGFHAAGMSLCDVAELLTLSALTPRTIISLGSS